MYCPCGREIEDGVEYFNFEVYDEQGNPTGFVCVHGMFISYGE